MNSFGNRQQPSTMSMAIKLLDKITGCLQLWLMASLWISSCQVVNGFVHQLGLQCCCFCCFSCVCSCIKSATRHVLQSNKPDHPVVVGLKDHGHLLFLFFSITHHQLTISKHQLVKPSTNSITPSLSIINQPLHVAPGPHHLKRSERATRRLYATRRGSTLGTTATRNRSLARGLGQDDGDYPWGPMVWKAAWLRATSWSSLVRDYHFLCCGSLAYQQHDLPAWFYHMTNRHDLIWHDLCFNHLFMNQLLVQVINLWSTMSPSTICLRGHELVDTLPRHKNLNFTGPQQMARQHDANHRASQLPMASHPWVPTQPCKK